MRYYIGHIHEYGKDVDRVYVQELALYSKVIEEDVHVGNVEARIKELKSKYPESNVLHFVY